jgi:membrane associated rhomboid family serine protease
MGIYDREYYRDDLRGLNWLSPSPAVRTIILINILVFILQFLTRQSGWIEDNFAAHAPEILKQGKVWQLLTATFLHDVTSPLHILWNMWFLWIIGHEMEAMYGSLEFTLSYVAAAIFSTFCWALVNLFGPDKGFGQMVGASGAVMAVMVLFTLHFPRREMIFIVIKLEMWVMLLIFLALDFLGLLHLLQGGNSGSAVRTAFSAHIGGALYGFFYYRLGGRWSKLVQLGRRRPRLRVITPEPRDRDRDRVPSTSNSSRSSASSSPRTSSSTATLTFTDEQFEERLDAVLAKIAREGRGGLTEEENRILQEASQRARNRRSSRL